MTRKCRSRSKIFSSGLMGLLLIFFLVGSLYGELRIVERDSFSEDSVNLSFSGFPLEHVQPEGGPEATDFLIDWGIRLTGSDGFSSKLDSWGGVPDQCSSDILHRGDCSGRR